MKNPVSKLIDALGRRSDERVLKRAQEMLPPDQQMSTEELKQHYEEETGKPWGEDPKK